jgi:superfamily II DNA or RNA helicase
VGLAFGVCKGIEFGLIAHAGERYTKVLDEAERVGFLSNDVWSTLEESFFAELSDRLKGKPHKLVALTPRPHQKRAIKNAKSYFANPINKRGKMIMPCASGKSLTGFWIADELEAKTVLVAVPSLALIQQTLPIWLREFTARGHADGLRWLCVCSDETVEEGTDSIIIHTQDLGYPPTTKIEDIVCWLDATKTAKKRVIFTTYQSGKVLAEAVTKAGVEIDLGIMDEAHKTVGAKQRLFSHLLFDNNVLMKRRVFMTATERRFRGESDQIASMEDPAIYGETFEHLSFKEALEQNPPILSDYKIITMAISHGDIEQLVAENRYVRPQGMQWDDEVEAQMLACLIALRKAMLKHKMKHAVSFHSSIKRAKTFRDFNDLYTKAVPNSGELETFHVTGATPSGARKRITTEFANASRSLITNARCLTEGVDIPNIDGVLFTDPKHSTIDIVQAVGRALRPAKGKRRGYVLVPVISRGEEGEAFVESEAFAQVLKILRALAANDERIIEWFRAKNAGRKPKGGIIEIDIDEKLADSIDLADFADKIETKIWSRLARLSWQPYEEAVKFVHTLELGSHLDWNAYCRGERKDLPSKPNDIPWNAARTYGEEFRNKGGWGAWLGTDTIATRKRSYRPYDDAVKFVHNLKLKNHLEWTAYVSSKPHDIPSNPNVTYGEEFRERGGWGAWLGTGTVANKRRKFRSYDEAVTFVHALELKSQKEWKAYCRGERKDLPSKPRDIPVGCSAKYGDEFRKKGGWGAWLGTGNVARRGPNRKVLPTPPHSA